MIYSHQIITFFITNYITCGLIIIVFLLFILFKIRGSRKEIRKKNVSISKWISYFLPITNQEIQVLRTQKYWLWTFIISVLFFSISLFFYYNKIQQFGDIAISIFIALLIASIIQIIQIVSIGENLKDWITDTIKRQVQESIDNVKQKIIPKRVYFGEVNNQVFNDKINNNLENSASFKFMSISGRYLLTKRLTQIRTHGRPLEISLLFLNPSSDDILKIRSYQISGFEDKSVEVLKNEIIEDIFRAYCLYKINNFFKISIRFHHEFPLARLEFSGGSNLFLSYYGSQVSAKDFGPVALYEFDSDVFKSYFDMFLTIWSCNETTEISLTKDFTSMDNLKLYIEHKLEIPIPNQQLLKISKNLKDCFEEIKKEFKKQNDNDTIFDKKEKDTIFDKKLDIVISWLDIKKGEGLS